MKRIGSLLTGIVLLAGCSEPRSPVSDDETQPVQKPSSAQTVVNGLTGRSAVRAGKKARRRIESVSREQNKDLNEVLGDE